MLSTYPWGPRVEDQQSGGVVSYRHHLGAARQEVQDPVAQGGVQTQGHKLNDGQMLYQSEYYSQCDGRASEVFSSKFALLKSTSTINTALSYVVSSLHKVQCSPLRTDVV